MFILLPAAARSAKQAERFGACSRLVHYSKIYKISPAIFNLNFNFCLIRSSIAPFHQKTAESAILETGLRR